MSLIRASDFCRPPAAEIVVPIIIERFVVSSKAQDEDTQSCGANLSFLRSAHLIAGSGGQRAFALKIVEGERCISIKIRCYDPDDDPIVDKVVKNDRTLFVSALTAINLGIIIMASNTEITPQQRMATIQPLSVLPMARDVVLMPVGLPLESKELPLPPETTLIQTGTLIAVSTTNNETYYYEVISVNGEEQPLKSEQNIYQATKQTIYRFTNRQIGVMVPRLPSFLSECWNGPFPHPDLPKLVQAWEYANPPYAISHLIHHLIGTEYIHHGRTLVREAAKCSGRRCIWVPGLAAFGTIQQQQQQPNSSSSTVTMGGVIDKLAGLRAAINVALTHAPSVLLLEDIDREFTSEESRVDLERRIWMTLSEQLPLLPAADAVTANMPATKPSQLPLQVPAVLVVMTTARPLAKGPLLQNLTWPSIVLSLPNDEYIRCLWNNSSKLCDDISMPEEAILALMKGRPAQEIVHLKRDLEHNKLLYTETDASDHDRLRDVCHRFDERRRHQSGSGRIPAVRWEDIGGLAHVRQEILDAIELPLQFPHLFGGSQPSKGRSGILLYGPPGTGKTLVAKAVATECGLPFLSVKGPELLGSYVGESEAQVRATFDRARVLAQNNQPRACILFFDELDSLAPRRGEHASGGNVTDRVVATLFVELDKDPVDNESFVFCMGATNRPDLLDPALLRPGRLDRLVYLGVNPADQKSILVSQMRKLRLEGDVTEMVEALIPHLPPNLTGADLSTIPTGALLRATERLCQEADHELLALRAQQKEADPEITIDDVLSTWTDDQLQPTVTQEDLLYAAQNVVPSVSINELKNYDLLGEKYKLSS